MKFHHSGYVYGDPRQKAADGGARWNNIPGSVDVLVVGSGPAGLLLGTQLAQFPDIVSAVIEQRAGSLKLGHADGIQSRTLEMFEAFGITEPVVHESQEIAETAFWRPDPRDAGAIHRAFTVPEDPLGLSEYPHVIVNQARIVDHLAAAMSRAPAHMSVVYGARLTDLIRSRDHEEYPVVVTIQGDRDVGETEPQSVRCKYVVGAEGAHSSIRRLIGSKFDGTKSAERWGVIGLLVNTDFPDIRKKCIIQSGSDGSMVIIPREGEHLVRLYVFLGQVVANESSDSDVVDSAEILYHASRILRPYRFEVKKVVWHSVYVTGHRLASKFDDRSLREDGSPLLPHVFLVGDSAHTHTPKLGQGMNVSMQDSFNLGWKLAHVIRGYSDENLLLTYAAERQSVGRDIIRFDKEWADRMAAAPRIAGNDSEMEAAYRKTNDFAQGLQTEYGPSTIIASRTNQGFAAGFPIGRRFRSQIVKRIADSCVVHLGHLAEADGRWRMYVFADVWRRSGRSERLTCVADWIMRTRTFNMTSDVMPSKGQRALFVIQVVYPHSATGITITDVPAAFKPAIAPLGLVDYYHAFVAIRDADVFETRAISRSGAVILVRPDQYVAAVFSLDDINSIEAFINLAFRSQLRNTAAGTYA